MNINIKYNKIKDAQWIVALVKSNEDFYGISFQEQIKNIPEDVVKAINSLPYDEAIKRVIANPPVTYHLRSKVVVKDKILVSFGEALKVVGESDSTGIFKKLTTDFGQELPTDSINVYLTTALMSSESDDELYSCFISIWLPLHKAITVLAHEIMHFYFRQSMDESLKRANWNSGEIEILKEAITVILNDPNYQEGLFSGDLGYPEHRKIRRKIQRRYKPGKLLSLFSEIIRDKNYYLYDQK